MNYPETVTFIVDRRHVDAGEYVNAQKCPVALAFADALRALGLEFDRVSVYGTAGVYESTDPLVGPVAVYDAKSAKPWQGSYDDSENGIDLGEAPTVPATFTFTKMEVVT